MMLRAFLIAALAVSTSASLVQAQLQSSPFGKAAADYSAKKYEKAEQALTELIEDDSRDPRVFFFRGLCRIALGRSDDAGPDFEQGARLEATGGSRVDVSRSLEKIQGAARRTIEKHRSAAKRAASLSSSSARRSKTLYAMYSQARSAYFRGDLKTSQSILDKVVDEGSQDPRVYYFRGLTLHGLGRVDDAKTDFSQAVALELKPGSRIDVDRALERVQGPARKSLESHREEKVAEVRSARQEARRQMIAQIATRQLQGSGGLIANSLIPKTDTQPNEPTVVSTTPNNPTTPTTPATTTTPSSSMGASIDLAWLPPDAAVVARINVRDIWQSALVRQYQGEDALKAGLAQMKQMTGLGPADIESITFGAPDFVEEAISTGGPPLNAGDEVVVVLRTRTSFDVSVLRNLPLFEAATHNGTSYFKPTADAAAGGGEIPSIYVADSKTLVAADEAALQKAIDQGADFDPRPEFDFLDLSKQILIGYVPDDPSVLTSEIPEDVSQDPSPSPSLNKLATAAKDNLLGLALSVGVNDNLEIGLSFLCTDDAIASEMNKAFAGLLDEGKGFLAIAREAMPPQIAGLADSLLRSVRSNAQSGTFSFSARITQQTIARGIAASEEIGQQVMGMMMAGAGGPGPIGPGNDDPPEPPMATAQPQNLQIATSAKISSNIETDFNTNMQLPRAIELNVDITGDQAKKASGFGFATLTSAKDNNGTDLKLRDRSNDPFGSPDGFTEIKHDDFFVDHPDDGCRVVLSIEPPAQAPTSITAVEGTVKLRIVGNASTVTVDNAKSLLGNNVNNAELTQAGYTLKIEETNEKFGDVEIKQWKLTWVNAPNDKNVIEAHSRDGGKGLQAPQLVGADGKVVGNFDGRDYSVGLGQASLAWKMTIQEDTVIPDDAKLVFRIVDQVDIVDVPFKASDVQIAPAN